MKYVFAIIVSVLLPLITLPSAHPHSRQIDPEQFFKTSVANRHTRNKHIENVIAIEGGYQNCPHDGANKGIGTKYGITPSTYRKYIGRQPSARQMKALSKQCAADIYVRIWYDSGMDLLPDDIAGDVFDGIVNTPLSALQIIERITGTKSCVAVFKIDEATAASIDAMPADVFKSRFKEARKQYYLFRAAKYNNGEWHRYFKKLSKSGKPNNSRYLKGWLKRLESVS